MSPQSRLRLSGGRYDERGFPIDGLPELIQYERLVLDVAKSLWMRSHPGRQRVPRGFEAAIGLRLIGVEEGSVIPVLERPKLANVLPDVDPPSLVDSAQDVIDEAFAEIIEFNRLPPTFPIELSGHFLRIGRTLRGNEALQFGRIGEPSLRYTQKVRQKFLSSTQGADFFVDGILLGRVTALDTNALTLTFTDSSGRQISGRYADSALTSDLRQVFDMASAAPWVLLECSQTLGADKNVKSIDDIASLEVFMAPESDFADDLLDLLNMQDGWLDGEGVKPDLIAVERARDLLVAAGTANLPRAAVFPRADGGVQVEWMTDSDVWTVIISADPNEPYSADYLEVVADESGEVSTLNEEEVVAFFVHRQGEVTID